MVATRSALAVSTAIAVAAGVGAAAGPADAAPSSGTPSPRTSQGGTACGAAPCLVFQHVGPSGRTWTSPIDGVVVRWQVAIYFTNDPSTTVRARVVHPEEGGTYRVTGSGRAETPPTDPGVQSYATRLPIRAGDTVGIELPPLQGRYAGEMTSPGSQAIQQEPAPPDNEPFPSPGGANIELQLNADIEPDADSDGFGDESQDNCPTVANADQADANGDGRGNACTDTDGDGVSDPRDNCPAIANADQADANQDATGDACDSIAPVFVAGSLSPRTWALDPNGPAEPAV